MDHHTRRSAFHGPSDLSSDDDIPGSTNEPTSTNDTTGSGPWVPSYATLEILQAHLQADADSDDSDSAEPRVHPDFFVHLERLRRLNETTRVNARREVEAWYEAMFGSNQSQNQASHMGNPQHHASYMPNQFQHHASHMPNQSQHQASYMVNPQHHASHLPNQSQHQASHMLNVSHHEASWMSSESHRGSSQFTNELNQPSYHTGAEHGLQPSAMGVHESYGTQDSTAAGPFELMPHVRFEASNPMSPAHPRDHSHHHRPPSPYPTEPRRQTSAASNPIETPAMPAPQRQRYTDWGNPYRFPFDPAPFPEGATPYAPERILQAWLIRQQLIAGVRPENIQPMAVPRGRQHRTPPFIMLNESGAHIIRIEPAAFEGTMLPLPALPWLPRRPNPNASTVPVSSNAPDASGLSTDPNTVTAPSSASTLNSSFTPNLSAATNPPVASHLPAAATLLAALSPPDPQTLPAAPSSASTLNLSTATSSSGATSHLQAAPTLPDSSVVSDPTIVQQSAGDLNQHVAESQNPDPRMVAFFQPLRLHEPANPVSASVPDPHLERPSTSEPSSNENSQNPMVTLQSQSQASVPLTVQNHTDADSISSQEVHGVGVSPAHSQGRESSTLSPLSNEGTETGNVPSPRAPNGNGVVRHAVTLSEPEDPDEPAAPRLRRFAIDGVDESLGVGRLSGEVKAVGDQSSLGGLI